MSGTLPDAGFFTRAPDQAPPPVPHADFFPDKPPEPDQNQPSFGTELGAGIVQGVHDLTDLPAQKLASAAGWTAHQLGVAPNWHPGQTTAGADIAHEQQFNQQYGNSIPANIGRYGTQALGAAAEIGAGGGLIGGLARGAAEALPEGAATVAGNIGRFAAGNAPGGVLPKAASLATRGALEGAAATAGTAGAQGTSPSDIAKGALIGSAAGPALGAASKGVGVAGGLFRHLFSSISDTPGLALNSAKAKILESLGRDGIKPEDAVKAMRDLGPDATLADVGGANTRLLAQGVASVPGSGADMAHTTFESRMAEQPTRIGQSVKSAVGGNTDFQGELDALMAKRSADARPLYENAFANDKIGPKEAAQFQRFVNDPIGQEALQRGLRTIQLEKLAANEPFDPAEFGVEKGQNGQWIVAPKEVRGPKGQMMAPQPMPGLRLLDAVKRGFDSIVADNRDQLTGRLNQYGRAVDQVRSSLVSGLRKTFPDYAKALDSWSDPSRAMDALRLGRDALREDADITAQQVANMTSGQKDFFRIGVGRALMDKLESTPDGANAVRRLFGNTALKNRVQAAFDDPQAFQQFQQDMNREAKFAETRNETLKGSQTARRVAAQADMARVMPHVVRALSGDLAGAVHHAAMEGIGRVATPSEHVNAALGKMLFQPGSADELQQQLVGWNPSIWRRGAQAAKAVTRRSAVPGVTSYLENEGKGQPAP